MDDDRARRRVCDRTPQCWRLTTPAAPSEDVGEEYHERDQKHGADHDDQPLGFIYAYMGSAAEHGGAGAFRRSGMTSRRSRAGTGAMAASRCQSAGNLIIIVLVLLFGGLRGGYYGGGGFGGIGLIVLIIVLAIGGGRIW